MGGSEWESGLNDRLKTWKLWILTKLNASIRHKRGFQVHIRYTKFPLFSRSPFKYTALNSPGILETG